MTVSAASTTAILRRVADLIEEHYVFAEIAAQLAGVLRLVGADEYPADERELAAAVTQVLQSVVGDKHLRLLYHDEPLPEHYGEDETDLATMAAWADRTGAGVRALERLDGNIAYLDVHPILFPTVVAGEAIAAAMTLVAAADALILDLRGCLGGEPGMVAFLSSYLFDEPTELSRFEDRSGRVSQSWTMPYVPGRRFGPGKPVVVLTGGTTFSGAEQLAYDLQQTGRATVVGQRSRGGAHPRRGFRIGPHLEASIPVARSVSPVSGSNWEGSGVIPDVEVSTEDARTVALARLAPA